MKRTLPLWVIAIVPATLVGHIFDYAVLGRNSSEGIHFWIARALQFSLALLASLCVALLAGALLNAGTVSDRASQRSVFDLWLRLAPAQMAMFGAMEYLEGSHPSLFGCAVQALVAICVAYALSLFSRLLVNCVERADERFEYVGRTAPPATWFVARRPQCVAYALAVRAGSSRFQRPPPIG